MSLSIPENLLYTEEHEWIDPDTGWVGITDFAQDELGDIVFVELPEVGRTVDGGEAFMIVESVKAVSDIYAPSDGEITAVNESLVDQPERVNESPYEGGRMIQLDVTGSLDGLLDAAAYREHAGS